MHKMHISFLLLAGITTFALFGCGSQPSSVEEIPVPGDDDSSSSSISSSSKPSSSSTKRSSSSQKTSSSSAISSSSKGATKLTDSDFIDIGGQLWTKQNLNIDIEGSRCFNDDPANCEKYGRLYTWAMAMNIDPSYDTSKYGATKEPHQGICPDGTHLPSHSEWQTLYDYVMKNPKAKAYFSTQTGGYYDYADGYKHMDFETVYWSSTEYDATGTGFPFHYAWLWAYRGNSSINYDNSHKISAVNVRCIKNGSKGTSSSSSKVESSSSAISSSSAVSSSSEKSSSSEASSSSFVFQPEAETIQIGNQVWMTKNLNIPVEGSFCYEQNEANCEKYGRLYTWSQAMGVDNKFDSERLGPLYTPYQGICPEGMRLPTHWEWETLSRSLNDAPEYKAYFMNQMGGVFDYKGKFRSLEEENAFWTSTEYNATGTRYAFEYAWLWAFHKDKSLANDNSHKNTGAYIRCIKGESATAPKNSSSIVLEKAAGCESAERNNWKYLNPSVEYGCIKDERDGKYYKTVVLGDRVWMAENLRYKSQKTSWCYKDVVDENDECDDYGRYYSGYAVAESPSICPEGFHIPTESEASSLGHYIPQALMATESWNKEINTFAGNNSTGFTLLPAGLRGYENGNGWVTGLYDGVGNVARFWSSAPYNGTGYYEYVFTNVRDDFGLTDKEKGFGIPVRCIKDL